jgi:membrane protein
MLFRQIKTVLAAVRAVYADSGFAMAGAVAFSFVLSLFPFCIFLGALAGVFGGEARAKEGIERLFEIVPKPVAEALAPEVMAVMGSSRYDLLTFGAFIALFFATSAIESLRAALNVAYRQKEMRSYAMCLLESTVFVILSAATASSSPPSACSFSRTISGWRQGSGACLRSGRACCSASCCGCWRPGCSARG